MITIVTLNLPPKSVCAQTGNLSPVSEISKPTVVLRRAAGHPSGKNSGRDTDKARRCAQETFPWEEPSPEVLSAPKTIAIVPDSAALMTLRMVSKQVQPGSRDLPAVVISTAVPLHTSSYSNSK